jgi:hypothetical protein
MLHSGSVRWPVLAGQSGPGTGRTTLDGELLAVAAAESVPLSRLYLL